MAAAPPHPFTATTAPAAGLLADLLRGASASPSSSHPATPCPLFPTESEDYYCLSCYQRCSGLALLVGPHTNHDYLPLREALLYMPAALLRETQETVRECTETFAKPWRVQDQQQERHLDYLLRSRQRKLQELENIAAELQQLDGRLLHLTEAKAVDWSNWRYQQRALRRKLEKLRSGAETLSSSLRGEASLKSPLRQTQKNANAASAPSWQHSREVAQAELAQVKKLLSRQLDQLREEETAAQQQLERWHRMLDAIPQHSGAQDTVEAAAAAQHTPLLASQNPPRDPFTSPPPPQPMASLAGAAEIVSTPSPRPTAPTYRAASEDTTQQQQQQHLASLHPSDAEVALLQHALHNINDGLRRRLLRAAAASLSSSSSSRAQSSSREGTAGDLPCSSAIARDTTSASLPALQEEASPLRQLAMVLPQRSPTDTRPPPGNEQQPPPPTFKAAVAKDGQQTCKAGAVISPPHHSAQERANTSAGPSYTVDNMADTTAMHSDHVTGVSQRWSQLQQREEKLKASLDQLLGSAAEAARCGAQRRFFTGCTSSSAESSRERSDEDYPVISAMSGPRVSLSAAANDLLEY